MSKKIGLPFCAYLLWTIGCGTPLNAGNDQPATSNLGQSSEATEANQQDTVSEDLRYASSPPKEVAAAQCCWGQCYDGTHKSYNLGNPGWGNCTNAAAGYCLTHGWGFENAYWHSCR